MSKPTYGEASKAKAKNVLRVLLDFANNFDGYEKFDQQCQDYFQNKRDVEEDIQDLPKYQLEEDGSELHFREIKLIQIGYLLRHHKEVEEEVREQFEDSRKSKKIKKPGKGKTISESQNNRKPDEAYVDFTKNYAREALNTYLHEYLGLISGPLAKQGFNKWIFTVHLFNKSVKTDENIKNFEEKWIEKQKEREQKTKNKNSYDNIPPQYKALIENKLKLFSGREFVFQAFEEFIENNPNGYFTVIGEPGIGKSAIAAKYVLDNQLPCFFNIASQGSNTTEQFVEEICTQLSERYNIGRNQNNLSAVLQNANDKLKQDEKLVIVVDALDEAQINQEQERSGQNILCLPRNLPNNVYFFLTRRPYTSQEKRLRLEPGIGFKDLDLNDQQYRKYNREDIKKYLTKVLENNDEQGNEIIRWIEGKGINQNDFIQQLLEKSQINFMYLRYVIGDIANGAYDDVKLNDLPSGLLEYYRDHWQRMKMNDDSKEIEVRVLLTLVALLTNTNSKKIQVTCNDIAHYIKESEFKVKPVLLKWKQFLLENKEKQDISYSFYHKSFLDFLEEEIIKEGCHGDLYEQIIDEIAVSIYGV